MKLHFIIFLGPDGSGKTTLINQIRKNMKNSYSNIFVKHLKPDCFRTPKELYVKTTQDPHKKQNYGFFISILKLIYLVLDYVLGYFLIVKPLVRKNCLVIFDRYYYDIFVDRRRYRYGAPILFARLFSKLIPLPQKIFILNASAEIIYKRKKEVSFDELRRQRLDYLNLDKYFNNVVILDASQSVSNLMKTIRKEIIDE